MKTVEDYLTHAAECDRLAVSNKVTEHRKMIEDMAATWRFMAEQRKRRLIKTTNPQANDPSSSD